MSIDATHRIRDVGTLSTGSLTIDLALGMGGLPRGRIIEIYGHESSGKTTLALQVIAGAQQQGGTGAFIDAEHALDPKYAHSVGVDLKDLLVSQPDSGEDAIRIAETLIRSGLIDVIVIDSMAALVSKQELDGPIGRSSISSDVRFTRQVLCFAELIDNAKCICILIHQIREKINMVRDEPAMVFNPRPSSSIRLDISHVSQIKDLAHRVIGNRTRLKVSKTDAGVPFSECEFDILCDQGISRESEIIELGATQGILEKLSGWYSYEGERIGFGKENARRFLQRHQNIAGEIEMQLRKKLMPIRRSTTSPSRNQGFTVA